MSNFYNDRIVDETIDIVDQMLEDKYITKEEYEDTLEIVYRSLVEERDFSIEAQTDDDSGDEQ